MTQTDDLVTAVRRLHSDSLIVEGHRDCYEQIHRLNEGEQNPVRDRLIPRLRAGGVDVVFYAIGGDTIAHSNGTDRPLAATLQNIDALVDALDQDTGVEVLTEGSQLPTAPDGRIRIILHLEGGKPLEGDLSSLRTLYRLGVRSAQLTWNVRNELADGVLDRRTGGGLSRFGADVVTEMNRLGMLVDLAHIAETGFWHAVEITQAPLVVTHANTRAVFDHPRNLTDAQVRAIADVRGVVGVHCLPAYVDPECPTLDRLVDHVVHIAELVGIEHVGLGADFPTSDGPRPAREQRFPRKHEQLTGLNEIDELPALTEVLLRRGFHETEVAAILGGNFVRVLRDVVGTAPTSPTNHI
ncbi:MAG TPA: membrane dipeptidase [Nocardioidaceae bacterium]|nr:membrane dipeptidase [Nocardioidaceae bacterium]